MAMSINPEKNPLVRATLYVVGAGGVIHLVTLFILAIVKQDAHYFNPLYTVDIDQLWSGARENYFVYVIGWIVFFSAIYLLSRFLKAKEE